MLELKINVEEMNRTFLIFFCSMLVASATFGQLPNTIRITGSVVDGETFDPIPLAHVVIKHSNIGTVTDEHGIFTLIARESDTIMFSSVGHIPSELAIPKGLEKDSYALLELLFKDTKVLEEVTIYPWPTPSDFHVNFASERHATSNARKTSTDEMQQHLHETLKETYQSDKYFYEQWHNRRMYELSGQISQYNILDPDRWAEFIKDMKEGTYKKNR